jgi:Protein of unknown function (DUF1064)
VNKYHAHMTVVDGIKFASAAEARRYGELKLLLWSGQIADLQLQVPYRLEVNGCLITTYVADFVYTDSRGTLHVEDTKGFPTRLYRLKKKLMQACHGITIEES